MTWGTLTARIALELPGRDDVVAMLPTLLPAAEARMYRGESDGVEPLRLAVMIKSVVMANGTRPTDWISAKRISAVYGGRDQPLSYRPLDQLATETYAFSWQGPTLVLGGYGTTAFPVTMVYYAKAAALNPADPASTNVIMDTDERLYLWSLLAEVASVLGDDAMLAKAVGNYGSAVVASMLTDKRAQVSGAPLTQGIRR